MAIYAPKLPGHDEHVQVASLVEANPDGEILDTLSSISIDGKAYAVASSPSPSLSSEEWTFTIEDSDGETKKIKKKVVVVG